MSKKTPLYELMTTLGLESTWPATQIFLNQGELEKLALVLALNYSGLSRHDPGTLAALFHIEVDQVEKIRGRMEDGISLSYRLGVAVLPPTKHESQRYARQGYRHPVKLEFFWKTEKRQRPGAIRTTETVKEATPSSSS